MEQSCYSMFVAWCQNGVKAQGFNLLKGLKTLPNIVKKYKNKRRKFQESLPTVMISIYF